MGDILSLESHADDVAIMWMDDPQASLNTLKRELIDEFEALLADIEAMPSLEVLVFASAKQDSFVAGANLDMLKDTTTAAGARELSTIAQALNNRIEGLTPVTVAAIHGACLGGGLELALAFDVRVASHDAKTQLGLPEVQLGLLPGGGGTQRLPQLIGTERALDLLLTGRKLSARQAGHVGLVDEIVAKETLLEAAVQRARAWRPQPRQVAWRRHLSIKDFRELALTRNGLGRRLLFDQARKRTLSKTRGNYPAPERILQVVRVGLEAGFEAGLRSEAEAFGELVVSPQARQLMAIFFANTALKKDRGIRDPQVETRPIRKVGVLGAGLMGAGIGYVTISKAGAAVRMKDKDDAGVGRGLAQVARLLDERVKKRAITPLQRAQTLAKLTGTVDYSGFANTDLVIEAVFEDVALKQGMLRDIEATTGEDTIFASNTSAIPIKQIASASRHPETVIGMHYFSPVEKMPLLEIVTTDTTARWAIATCVEFGKQQGKTVIVVNDGPGFYTSRILGPYMNEAVHLLLEGVAIDRIDRALQDFGFAVGPMTLLDEVGIDVGRNVADTLHRAFGERMAPPPSIGTLIDDKRLGRKNARGMYRYQDGRKRGTTVDDSVYTLLNVEPVNALSDHEVAERCTLQMINEAAHCLGEGILRSAQDGDIGAIFGLGFPAFRGGPFRYLDERGATEVTEQLQRLQDRYGPRFAPAPLLFEKASAGETFYPA